MACAIAALSDHLDGATLKQAKEIFQTYLAQKGRREIWSKARVLACLDRELVPEKRDVALDEIIRTVEGEAPEAEGFDLMRVVGAAAMAAWERRPDDADGLTASSAAIDAAIKGLREEDPFMASISRSLVSMIAALPSAYQIAALDRLLSSVNELPEEASIDPDVLLILAQAFEGVAEQPSSDEAAKELIDRAEHLLTDVHTARGTIGIARLVAPLAGGRPKILEELLLIAGVKGAPADAADELLIALAEVGGKISDPRELQAAGLRIGLQGRLLALFLAEDEEGRGKEAVDAVSVLSHAIGGVGRTVGGEPVLPEPQQHIARESLARAFAALAPRLDANQRETALTTAKGALASTGSAEEAAAWATAITNLLADRKDGFAVNEIVEILKYPTAALTAREPNAIEPRNATDILAQALAQRLKLPTVEPLHPTDLHALLNSAEDLFDVDLETRPSRPEGGAPAI